MYNNNWQILNQYGYSEFLGIQNTEFGQWVNRTFSKKKALQQQGQAIQNMQDAAEGSTTNLVDVAPPAPYYPTFLPPIIVDNTTTQQVNVNTQQDSSVLADTPIVKASSPSNNNAGAQAVRSTGTVALFGVVVIVIAGTAIYLFKKHKKK